MIDAVAYFVARGVIALCALLPLAAALALGRCAGAFWFHVLRIRRGVVLANLRHVFGDDRPEHELQALALESYRQFGMNIVEFARALRGRDESADLVTIPELETFRRLQQAGEAMILCIPHAGNFDRMGCAAAAGGLELHAMMSPLKSRRFHALLVASRERGGLHLLMKGGDSVQEMFELLEAGKTVVLLPDQNARRGVTVDFLGKPAVTFQGPAVLHLLTGARIAVAVDRRRRDDPTRHDASFRLLPLPRLSGDRKRDIREITQRICDAMSEEILAEPAQYLWLHRRWGKQVASGGRQSRPTRSEQGRKAAAQRGEAERSVGPREGLQASEGGPLHRRGQRDVRSAERLETSESPLATRH